MRRRQGDKRRCRRRVGAGTAALAALTCLWAPGGASAAGPPSVTQAWASLVTAASARLHAEIDRGELATTYHFEYVTEAAFQANGFAGAVKAPAKGAGIGSGGAIAVFQQLSGLKAATSYRYRAVATNTAPGTATGPARSFTTRPPAGGALLPDGRVWEMVSPVEKGGGQVAPPGAIASGGLLQAAAAGGALTYGSTASFGGGEGAPPASQYVAARSASGWLTQNVSAPLFSGTYDTAEGGAPYRVFSTDLARGLLWGGEHCRDGGSGCPVANPPPAGAGAPAGYANYYLRDAASGGFAALVGSEEAALSATDPADFELSLAGASPDLRHVVLSSCVKLTTDASDGCGSGEENLYLWSEETGLGLINPAPGARLAAPIGAVADGGRVYWNEESSGDLYLREGSTNTQIDAAVGGGGTFETASLDGSVALYTKAGRLYRHSAPAGTNVDLTPGGGVLGVLGASADSSRIYYATTGGVFLSEGGTSVPVAAGADPGNWPPATGTARVSADGTRLAFVATAPLTGYDNTDLNTGLPDPQAYLYDATAAALTCASCNPTGGRPVGPSSLPGALQNGAGALATSAYKPRALSADGRRLFFSSDDALVLTDTNGAPDVYQWEAQGAGSCDEAGGCVALISSGRDPEPSTFVDASAGGSDVFFITARSLVGGDPGSLDVYDARIGGGFPEATKPILCGGDSCQVLPPEPTDPTLTTLLAGPGNPPVRYQKPKGKPKKPRSKRSKGKGRKRGERGARRRGGRR